MEIRPAPTSLAQEEPAAMLLVTAARDRASSQACQQDGAHSPLIWGWGSAAICGFEMPVMQMTWQPPSTDWLDSLARPHSIDPLS